MADMDSISLFSSEVFRELVKLEKEAEHNKEIQNEKIASQYLDEFDSLNSKIKKNPELKKKFAQIRQKLISDPEFRKKANEDFVRGIMLLNLD